MGNQNHQAVEYAENKYLYKTWKIILQANKLFQAIRIRPTYFFTATSLTSAVYKIDKLEVHRLQHGDYPSFVENKQKLMTFLHDKKKMRENG